MPTQDRRNRANRMNKLIHAHSAKVHNNKAHSHKTEVAKTGSGQRHPLHSSNVLKCRIADSSHSLGCNANSKCPGRKANRKDNKAGMPGVSKDKGRGKNADGIATSLVYSTYDIKHL